MNIRKIFLSTVLVLSASLSLAAATKQNLEIKPYDEARDKDRIVSLIQQFPYTFFMFARKEMPATVFENVITEFAKTLSLPNQQIHVIQDENALRGFIVIWKMPRPSIAQLKKNMKTQGASDQQIEAVIPGVKGLYPEWPDESDEVITKVTALGVDPQFQRQGIGKQLMEFAENLSKKREPEIKTIAVDVHQDNAGAILFYESLGYKRVSSNAFMNAHLYEKNVYPTK